MQPENRRGFVKMSVATTISLSSATFFSSLIRARGDEVGETTTEVFETTFATTDGTTNVFDTTIGTANTEETTADPFETTVGATEHTTEAATTEATEQTSTTHSPGVKRTAPLSLVDLPDPLTVDLQLNGVTVAVLRASVSSDQATSNEACRLVDFVTYNCLAELCASSTSSPLAVGGEAKQMRYFEARREGGAIESSEKTANNGASPNGATVNADSGHDVSYGGGDYRLYVETERTVVGENTVTVKARGVIKIKNGSAYNFHIATEWITRTTTWATCEDA